MNERNQSWCHPGGSLDLPTREVHVWRARLSSSTADLSRRRDALSSEEQERSDRFRSEPDRTRFVLGRIVARSVLGHCLQQLPGDVQLTLDNLGKPVVVVRSETPIHFNISHSGDYV